MFYKTDYSTLTQKSNILKSQKPFFSRYMYVEGNPVRFGDSSGNKKDNAVLGAIAGYYFAESMGLSKEQGAFLGGQFGNWLTGEAMEHSLGIEIPGGIFGEVNIAFVIDDVINYFNPPDHSDYYGR